jgi:hypothetical protein
MQQAGEVPMSRALAALVFVLAWLIPAPAEAQISCEDLGALLDLPPAEQTAFEAACAGPLTDEDQREQLYLGLDRLLRTGGWRATLAMRSLARPSPPSPAVPTIQRLLDHPGNCKAFDDAITRYLADRELGNVPRQIGLESLTGDAECTKQLEKVRTQLDVLIRDHVLLTFIGEPTDKAEVLTLDRTSDRMVQVGDRLEHRGLLLLLVPRGQRALIVVEQIEYDLAWTITRIYNRNAALERQHEVSCLDAEFATDSQSDLLLLADGQPIAATLIEQRSTSTSKHELLRMVLSLPPGEHDLVMVPRGRLLTCDEQRESEALTFAKAIEAQLGVERRLPTVTNVCTPLSQDFRGLQTNQTRYGIAQIEVDDACIEAGLAPARIRRHVEQYADNLASVRLEQLDAWSETLAIFQSLREGTDEPSKHDPLDDGQRTSQLAEEVMRQGVDVLLFFELHCNEDSDQVDFLGTQIDLRSYSLRPKSNSAGTETGDLRKTRLHTAPRKRAREAIDVVLGDLFGTGHVRVSQGAGGERGIRRYVSVASEYPRQLKPKMRIEIHRVPSADEPGSGMGHLDICGRLDAIHSLGLEANLAELHEDTLRLLEQLQVSSVLDDPAATLAAIPKSEHELIPWDGVVEATGLAAGEYVVWVSRQPGPSPTNAADQFDARCFEVTEPSLEIWASMATGVRTRGVDPRYNPRRDQANHLRVLAGLRARSHWFLEGGGLLGYEYVQYHGETTPSWEDFDGIELGDTGSAEIDWARHGLLVGLFVGVDLPFAACAWRTPHSKPCRGRLSRVSGFVNAQVIGNLGFLDTRDLPADFTGVTTTFDPDADLSVLAGVRVITSPRRRLSMFFASTWADIDSVAAIAFDPSSRTAQAALLTFDFAWRWTLGIELAFALRPR